MAKAIRKRALLRDDESTPSTRRTTVLRNAHNNTRVRSAEFDFDDGSTLLQIVVQTGYDWMHVYYDDYRSEVVRVYGIDDTEQRTFDRAKKNLAERGWDLSNS
jgi:hypothetical protein